MKLSTVQKGLNLSQVIFQYCTYSQMLTRFYKPNKLYNKYQICIVAMQNNLVSFPLKKQIKTKLIEVFECLNNLT